MRRAELPSQGVLPGAVQVPPDGQPIILGWDGPVTGGYPVIAGVISRRPAQAGAAAAGRCGSLCDDRGGSGPGTGCGATGNRGHGMIELNADIGEGCDDAA
jgi:hypothetical protein